MNIKKFRSKIIYLLFIRCDFAMVMAIMQKLTPPPPKKKPYCISTHTGKTLQGKLQVKLIIFVQF